MHDEAKCYDNDDDDDDYDEDDDDDDNDYDEDDDDDNDYDEDDDDDNDDDEEEDDDDYEEEEYGRNVMAGRDHMCMYNAVHFGFTILNNKHLKIFFCFKTEKKNRDC